MCKIIEKKNSPREQVFFSFIRCVYKQNNGQYDHPKANVFIEIRKYIFIFKIQFGQCTYIFAIPAYNYLIFNILLKMPLTLSIHLYNTNTLKLVCSGVLV